VNVGIAPKMLVFQLYDPSLNKNEYKKQNKNKTNKAAAYNCRYFLPENENKKTWNVPVKQL